MNNYSKIYWLTRLDGINGFFIAMAIISAVLIIGIAVYYFLSKDFDEFHNGDRLKIRIQTK